MTSDLEKRLISSQLDAASLATVPQELHLTDTPLYDEPFLVALPNDHSLAKSKTIDLNELHSTELLLLADGHCFRDQMIEACNANPGSASANTRETSLETLLALVAAGDGVTLLPALAEPSPTSGNKDRIIRPEKTGKVGRTVRLVSRTSFPRPKLLGHLADIIQAEVPASMRKKHG